MALPADGEARGPPAALGHAWLSVRPGAPVEAWAPLLGADAAAAAPTPLAQAPRPAQTPAPTDARCGLVRTGPLFAPALCSHRPFVRTGRREHGFGAAAHGDTGRLGRSA